MLTEELQIYRDTTILASTLLEYNHNISRLVRFSVYADALSAVFRACDLIYVANSDISNRYETLQRYLIEIGGVRTRIRLLHEQRYLDVRKTTNLMHIIEKVSKQATGWRNSCARRELQRH